ncbi:MAG: hypothetical protein PVS2B2_22000 [Candidatus Acidiferrum sp.]
MAEKISHLKGKPQRFSLQWQVSDTLQTLVSGEGHLLELISQGAPLPTLLDKLCTAVDGQVGDIGSLILLPDDDDIYINAVALSAVYFGFSIFRSADIFSRSGDLLGTFKTYCRTPRTPTPGELKLFNRATSIAALAIQRHSEAKEYGIPSHYWKGSGERSSFELPWSKN